MCNRSLGKFRGAFIGRQYIRVAVFAEATGLSRFEWIIPGTGAHLDDALSNLITDSNAGQAGTPVIEHGYYVTRLEVTLLGINWME